MYNYHLSLLCIASAEAVCGGVGGHEVSSDAQLDAWEMVQVIIT